ncbi:MAG: hypothetical protein LRY72_17095 [Saccharospirillaceae bacterium]|nr:hypothetical protein [Saccharospirillaceae bacterium]
MNKHDLQQQIQHQENRDKWRTNRWMQSQGFSAESFAGLDLIYLQAQRIAYICLKHHGRMLTANEAQTLKNFLQALQTKAKQRRLKPAQAYKIMNIGKRINRQLFKQHRQHPRQHNK